MQYETRIVPDHALVATINNYVGQHWSVYGMWVLPVAAQINNEQGVVVTFARPIEQH